MADDESEKFIKFMEDVLGREQKAYQNQMLNDLFYGPYKTNTKDYFTFDQPKIHTLYKREDILIEYHEKDKKYICEYAPLGITITIPEAMLDSNIMINSYYGIGMQVKADLAKVCSRIVFAIKNFGPTLNAICERIENDKLKERGPNFILDIPMSICYIRQEEKVLPSPDWEIMERA